MPLGKLSKGQIAKGFEVLEEIENCLKSGANQTKLNELASKFYTVIPQDFGRQRPPPINNQEALQKKYDMLIVNTSWSIFRAFIIQIGLNSRC